MPGVKDKVIWGNVEELLKEKQWTLTDLARVMGSSPQAINSIKTRGIGARSIKKLSKALNVDEVRLLRVDEPVRHPRPIPVISWVRAGSFGESADPYPPGVSEEGEPVHSIKSVGPNAFALRVEGDSMAPRYLPGDFVVVDPSVPCASGSPCVVSLNGEAVFKVYMETKEAILLQPINKKYPEITIRKESGVDFRVVGKVVDLIADI